LYIFLATILDPHCKNITFVPEFRPAAFDMIIKELEKIQDIKPPNNNNNSPLVKRAKVIEKPLISWKK
jgi:hypothetical protein